MQVYPGLCKTGVNGCPGGTNLCIAKPADTMDQLQTNWTKDAARTGAVNPIVNATGRDPTTAWQVEATGEWRLSTFDTTIYGSMDFNSWYTIGPQPGFPHGECPSFFEMPRDTPGAGPAPVGTPAYTHVHKASHGGDWMQVGIYQPNGVRQNGDWLNATTEVKIDMGQFYASKDFYDPVGKRRINWGWAQVPPSSTQTLPREVTWHPELQQLVYAPLAEQDALRGTALADVSRTALAPSQVLALGPFPGAASAGNQSEVEVVFERPAAAARLGVVVMGGADPAGSGTLFYIDYVPPAATAAAADDVDAAAPDAMATWSTVTVGATPMVAPTPAPAPTPPSPAPVTPYKRLMPNTDLTGGDFSVGCANDSCKQAAGATPYAACQKACDDNDKCASWTLVVNVKCCLKSGYPKIRSDTGMFSGVKDPSKAPVGPPTPPAPAGGKTDTLKLSPSDKTLTLRVYVDNTFSEAFWMGGRVAMTVSTAGTPEASMAVTASAAATLVSAKAFAVKPIWITEAEVRAAPRTDGKPIRGW